MAENSGKQWIFTLVGVLIILALFGLPLSEKIRNISIGSRTLDLSWMGTTSEAVAEYVFGIKDSIQFQGANLTPYATLIIFLMIWLIIFVTFGDIIETFSSFNPSIAWLIAFCLATIAGFSGIYEGPTSKAIIWLASWGAWAVAIGIFFSFIVFILVETGAAGLSQKLRMAIMNRKLTQEAMGVKGKLMRAGMGAEALADFEKTIAKSGE
jgi:hypothetical protein